MAERPVFPKGNTFAKDNKNPAKKRIRRSKLRKTLEKLHDLEPKAMENIKKSVDGDEIDKEMLASSKWVVNSLVTMTKAASQDEAELNGLRWKADAMEKEEEEKEKDSEEEITSARFVPYLVDDKAKKL